MRKQVDTSSRRCQDGGIAQRRHLIAEIGTRNDGTRRPRFRYAQRMTDTQQRHANGGNSSPRRTRQQRDKGTDNARRHQEELRRHNLHTIIYQRRHDAANHPRTRQHTHAQQYQQRHTHATQRLRNLLLEPGPRHPIDSHRQTNAHRHTHQQGYLAATGQRVAAEQHDNHAQESYQHHHRNDGHQRMRQYLSVAFSHRNRYSSPLPLLRRQFRRRTRSASS